MHTYKNQNTNHHFGIHHLHLYVNQAINPPLEKTQSVYHQRDEYAGQHVGNITTSESETGLASDSLSDNEGFDDVNVVSHGVMDVSQTSTSSGNKGDNSLMVQYNIAKDDEILQITKSIYCCHNNFRPGTGSLDVVQWSRHRSFLYRCDRSPEIYHS